MTREEQEELHEKVQSMLRQYCMKSKQTRKDEQRRQALLVRLDMDAQLILSKTIIQFFQNLLRNFLS